MNVKLSYYVVFGNGDGSDWLDWDIDLTEEETEAYKEDIENEEAPNEDERLAGVLERAYNEIYEVEKGNLACYDEDLDDYELTVEFNMDDIEYDEA